MAVSSFPFYVYGETAPLAPVTAASAAAATAAAAKPTAKAQKAPKSAAAAAAASVAARSVPLPSIPEEPSEGSLPEELRFARLKEEADAQFRRASGADCVHCVHCKIGTTIREVGRPVHASRTHAGLRRKQQEEEQQLARARGTWLSPLPAVSLTHPSC